MGYKRPPTLIGLSTVTNAQRLLRAKHYAAAYKSTTTKDWNDYIAFGIQQFESPAKYFAQCDAETPDEKNLRLARYYRLHLENNAQVERHLMQKISTVETALKVSYPGYFEMSVGEMDEYVRQLSPDPMALESQIESDDTTGDIMEAHPTSHALPLSTISARTRVNVRPVTSPPKTGIHYLQSKKINSSRSQMPVDVSQPTSTVIVIDEDSMDTTPLTQATLSSPARPAAAARSVTSPSKTGPSRLPKAIPPSSEDFPRAIASIRASNMQESSEESPLKNSDATQPTPLPLKTAMERVTKIPTKVRNVLRVEVRWAPKDFTTLKASKALMYTRFAPILSSFNTTHTWVVEWQTDQLAKANTIPPTQVDQFLSICCVTSTKQKCFYFSFRLNATGAQFIQALKSKEMQSIKRGESISFDPSAIPQTQGEVTQIGDILLKDATSTHRGQYLDYLRSEVLPADMPPFDLKIRHKDPSGVKIQILTVRCGKQVATQVAQILSSTLNGEGPNPEIFISRLALGANRITRGDHERIYQVHHDFMDDIVLLPFLSSKQIDTPIVEYLDTGEQLSRTPRQWAKSLCDIEGVSLEVDMENGLPDGEVVLIVPSIFLEQTTTELHKYWQRQNPMLMNAERFYSASVLADPDIPLTVFTKNIDTILAKKIQKKTKKSAASEFVLSPASSITGQTSRTSKTSVAWQVPLQHAPASDTWQARSAAQNDYVPPSSSASTVSQSKREREQQKRISTLEAQLASMSAGNSRTSGDKSQ